VTSDRTAPDGDVPVAGSAFLLTQIGTHAAEEFATRVAELDLTPPQAGLLRAIALGPGRSQQALARHLGTPATRLVALVDARTVTAGNARVVLDRLVADGGDPAEIIEREDLGAMGDSGDLAGIVAKVIEDNPDVVERIRGGNPKAMGALVGPVMRETKGKADGGEVNRLIREQLGV